MKLDLNKLRNVKRLGGGKTTAQCPACAAEGADAKREHLVIFPDGKFGCVVHAKDKEHNKAILKLAGSDDRGDDGPGCRLTVKPMRVEASKVLMKVGRLGRVKPSPTANEGNTPPYQQVGVGPQGPTESLPVRPAVEVGITEDNEPWADGMTEDLQRFLTESVN